MEIKWDANRDPNQKLAVTVDLSNPEAYVYGGNFVISYPGRTVNGVFDFAIRGKPQTANVLQVSSYTGRLHLAHTLCDSNEVENNNPLS